jgi:hypothetical protein
MTIMEEMNSVYTSFTRDIKTIRYSGNPLDRRLAIAAYFLSLIIILEKKGEPYDRIRAVCLEIVLEYIRPKNRFQRLLKSLPPRLVQSGITRIFLRYMDRKIKSRGHPDGFKARVVTDKELTFGLGFGIDILECGICKLFARLKKQKYVPILCEVDHYTSELAGLELIRTGTIAGGADKCDFRFKKHNKNS